MQERQRQRELAAKEQAHKEEELRVKEQMRKDEELQAKHTKEEEAKAHQAMHKHNNALQSNTSLNTSQQQKVAVPPTTKVNLNSTFNKEDGATAATNNAKPEENEDSYVTLLIQTLSRNLKCSVGCYAHTTHPHTLFFMVSTVLHVLAAAELLI